MDFVLLNRNELEAECTSLKMLNEILKSQRYDSLALLDRLEREKRAAEVEQFSKFVLVLNAKKAKIAELRQQLTRELNHRASQSQNARHSQGVAGVDASRSSSLAVPTDPMQDTFDPLDAQFDSHEIYSLSTPQFSKRKGDLILEGKIKEVAAATKASPSKPHNLFDLHTPSSLAITSSSLKRQSSQQSETLKHQTRVGLSAKRSRLDDVLAMDDSDEDMFPLPEPKRRKY